MSNQERDQQQRRDPGRDTRTDQQSWRLYATDDGSVSVAWGDKGGPIGLGSIDAALALAERIRAEFIPDTSGAPGAVRVRQAWRASVDPHAVIVVHVQTPELTLDEFRALAELISAADGLASMVKRRLHYRGPGAER